MMRVVMRTYALGFMEIPFVEIDSSIRAQTGGATQGQFPWPESNWMRIVPLEIQEDHTYNDSVGGRILVRPLFCNYDLRKEAKTAVVPEYSPVRGEFVRHRSSLKKAEAAR